MISKPACYSFKYKKKWLKESVQLVVWLVFDPSDSTGHANPFRKQGLSVSLSGGSCGQRLRGGESDVSSCLTSL